MSAGDLPERPVPAPTVGTGPAGGTTGPRPVTEAPPVHGPAPQVEVDGVLAALAALPEDAPVLDQAALLEDAQERLARLLSGAGR